MLGRLLFAPQIYTISSEYRQGGMAFFVVLPIIGEPLHAHTAPLAM